MSRKSGLAASPINPHVWMVKSSKGNGDVYYVRVGDFGANCDCPDFVFRSDKKGTCKHIEFVEKLRKESFNGES